MVRRTLLPLLLALSLLVDAVPARSQDEGGGPTPPRVSYLDGEVSFWRPGADDWAPAHVNTPLAEGDNLYTGAGANAEVQTGARAFVRIGQDTQLGVDGLENDFLQLKVTGGHAALDFRTLPRGTRVEVDTPHAAITIDDDGYYRVIVGDAGTRLIVRRGGAAIVTPAGGQRTEITDGTEATIENGSPVRTQQAPEPDAWDRWNYDRGDQRTRPAQHYVPDEVYGGEELEQYGNWRTDPTYGPVWYPSTVAVGWTPYSVGNWIYDPFYGWTWCDAAPWGWAPFHYGRWVWAGGYWGWAPGPIVAAPLYAPALVAFFGPVSVGIGLPFVSWVPLGWGEPCHPWWGGYGGHPWWGGWGGPHYNVVNVTNVNIYRNARVHDGVVSVQREGFGRGRIERVHLGEHELRNLRPVDGRLDVRPHPASFAPGEGRGHRPPDRLSNRTVVATREPRDPGRRLQEQGIAATTPGAAGRPRRLVEAPARQATRGGEPVRPRGFQTPDRGGDVEAPRRNTTNAPTGTWRSNRQPPPVPRNHGGGQRPRGYAEPPTTPRRGGGNPNVYVPNEPRQAPRRSIDRQAPSRAWGAGRAAPPPHYGGAPHHQTPVAPTAPAMPAAPSQPTTGGGGAPNMGGGHHHGGGGAGGMPAAPRFQRMMPPPVQRNVGVSRQAPRTAWTSPRATPQREAAGSSGPRRRHPGRG